MLGRGFPSTPHVVPSHARQRLSRPCPPCRAEPCSAGGLPQHTPCSAEPCSAVALPILPQPTNRTGLWERRKPRRRDCISQSKATHPHPPLGCAKGRGCRAEPCSAEALPVKPQPSMARLYRGGHCRESPSRAWLGSTGEAQPTVGRLRRVWLGYALQSMYNSYILHWRSHGSHRS